MNFFIKHKAILLGALTGAIAGYAYYHFIGCASGTCQITSKPLNSTVYGALMGALLFTGFRKDNISNKKPNGKES